MKIFLSIFFPYINRFIKFTFLFLAPLFALHGNTQEQDNEVTNEFESSDEAEMLEMLGYLTVHRDGFKELGFEAQHAEYICNGIKKALSEKEYDISIEEKMPQFIEFIDKRFNDFQEQNEKFQAVEAKENIISGTKFLESLKLDDRVQISATGLYFKILEPGNLNQPTMDDIVKVHYKGTRISGEQFDSSYDRGQPADFPLSGVIPGFAEGLRQIGEGGKIVLYIPSELGYGNNPPGNIIKPGDTLIFECELIKVNP